MEGANAAEVVVEKISVASNEKIFIVGEKVKGESGRGSGSTEVKMAGRLAPKISLQIL